MQFHYDHDKVDEFEHPGYTETFVGHDTFGKRLNLETQVPQLLYTEQLDENIAADAVDKSGQWFVNTAKSSKVCSEVGDCVFNAHFFRQFLSEDD